MLTSQTIVDTAAQMQVLLTPDQGEQFVTYASRLVEWNQKINLTAITDDHGILIRHIADSLSLLMPIPALNKLASAASAPVTLHVMDVGTGAGFPGLALKIARPDLVMTLIDGTGKKITFCQAIIDELRLTGIRALQARADDLAHDPKHREQYDLVTARAVAPLSTLVEYLLPFCRIGGSCVALKGADAAAEVATARNAIRQLGSAPQITCPIQLPGVPDQRALIVMHKIESTRARFPRTGGAPRNAPL